MMENIKTNDLTKLTAKGKFVIEFYETGCFNCQMMTPLLTNLEPTMPEIRFYSADADKYPDLVQKYQIKSLPTMLLFRQGKLVSAIIGVKSQQAIKSIIDQNLNA